MKHFSELTPSAERIVDVAEVLIQELGFNGFSFEDVARQVGIRKPSIHHHFATKVDLGVTVTQRYTHRFREALLHIEGRSGKAPERLSAYAELFENAYAQNRRLCICGMLGAESDSLADILNTEVKGFFQINLDWLSRVLAQGQADGTLAAHASHNAWPQTLLAAMEGAMLVGRGLQSGQGPRQVMARLLPALTPGS